VAKRVVVIGLINQRNAVTTALRTEVIPVPITIPVTIADLLINKNKQNEKANKPIPPSCGKTQPEQKNYFKPQ
jgi:hypothetical protein